MAANNQKISTIANSVVNPLSYRKAEFEPEMSRITGEVNQQLGGEGKLAAGIAVYRFALAIEAELRNRAQLAAGALGTAVDSQQLGLSQKTVDQLKESIQEVWNEETQDLSEWYKQRVSVHDEIAEERPFPSAEETIQGIFTDVENRALAPGFWGRNKDKILVGVSMLIIGWILGKR